jgi:predicted acyl esterase
MLRRIWVLVAVFSFVSLAASKEEMVKMRDGVKLATSIYLPDGEGPWPAVLTRTPYGKDRGDGERTAAPFLSKGYVRVVQDCRGRFKSEGQYRAFIDDIDDGYDTVEWIAKQPWSNGKVGMTGGSAMGITSNLAAMSGAPHLVAAYVSVAHGSSYRYSSFPGGVFLKNLNEEWLRRQGVPPSDVPRPIIRSFDADYKSRDMNSQYAKVNVPFYNVGGWYDIFLQGNIDNFVGLQSDGGPKARGNQKLLMGAFGHGPLSGDLKYPQDAGNMGSGETMRWFDHWLKGIDTGIMKEPPIKYYVMGDTVNGKEAGDRKQPGNEWRTADRWPPPATLTSFYLQANGKLSTSPAREGKLSFVYDPRDPVPSVGGNNLMMDRGPMDQRKVSSRKDVLKFETEPLTQAVEIVGRISAELHVSTDAEDTDFMVKLVDVYPNGYEALVLDEAYRLRYHQGLDKPARVEKNKVYPIKVDLWSTALVFGAGHKIAVHVSSSNSPRFEAHSNTWDPVKSYDLSVKATNSVYLRGSHLVLPVTKTYQR